MRFYLHFSTYAQIALQEEANSTLQKFGIKMKMKLAKVSRKNP